MITLTQLAAAQSLKFPDKIWTFSVGATYGTDSNIEKDETNIRSVARILSFGVSYKNPIPKPTFEIGYNIAEHQFSNSDRYDRVSHNLAAHYESVLNSRLKGFLEGEISIKGSNEDRELFNQYEFKPGLEYKLDGATRLVLEHAFRRRIDPDDERRNANNFYTQLSYVRKLNPAARLRLIVKREFNRASDDKNDYGRMSYGAEYRHDLSQSSRFTLDARFKFRDYLARTIDDEGDPLRKDKNVVLSASYEQALTDSWVLSFDYRFETRTSNEPGKGFRQQTLLFGATYRWGTP